MQLLKFLFQFLKNLFTRDKKEIVCFSGNTEMTDREFIENHIKGMRSRIPKEKPVKPKEPKPTIADLIAARAKYNTGTKSWKRPKHKLIIVLNQTGYHFKAVKNKTPFN